MAFPPWGVPLQTGRASLPPIPALLNQCLFSKAGSFLQQGLRVVSPPHTGWSGGLGHCSCKTSADLDRSGNAREEITSLSYWREPSPALLHGECRLLSALYMKHFSFWRTGSCLNAWMEKPPFCSFAKGGFKMQPCSWHLFWADFTQWHADLRVQSTVLFLGVLWVWDRGRWLVALWALCSRGPLLRWEQPCPFPLELLWLQAGTVKPSRATEAEHCIYLLPPKVLVGTALDLGSEMLS